MARPIEADGNVIPFRRRNTPKPDWIAAYVRFWTEALDQLSAYLDKLQTEENPQCPTSSSTTPGMNRR